MESSNTSDPKDLTHNIHSSQKSYNQQLLGFAPNSVFQRLADEERKEEEAERKEQDGGLEDNWVLGWQRGEGMVYRAVRGVREDVKRLIAMLDLEMAIRREFKRELVEGFRKVDEFLIRVLQDWNRWGWLWELI